MWQLIKTEFKYNFISFFFAGILFPLYTFFALIDYQLLEGPRWEIDYWAGLLSLFLYLIYFIVWSFRIKEFRIRMHSLVPLSNSQISLARLLFAILPLILIFFYIIIVHLILLPTWREESGSILMQIGLLFSIFITYIFIRDTWFIYFNKNIIKRILIISAIILSFMILFSLVFLFVRPAFYDFVGRTFGQTIFYLWAFILSGITLFSYQKRKTYLT
jgi:hypothetical protein